MNDVPHRPRPQRPPPGFQLTAVAIPMPVVKWLVIGFLALAVGDLMLGAALMIHLLGGCR